MARPVPQQAAGTEEAWGGGETQASPPFAAVAEAEAAAEGRVTQLEEASSARLHISPSVASKGIPHTYFLDVCEEAEIIGHVALGGST